MDKMEFKLCKLLKNAFLRWLLLFFIIVDIVLFMISLNNSMLYSLVMIVTILIFLMVVFLQIIEKVTITGSVFFGEEEIYIEIDTKKEKVLYSEVKDIQITSNSIKHETSAILSPFLYLKKGCNNWISITKTNDQKIKLHYFINSELEYKKMQLLKERMNW